MLNRIAIMGRFTRDPELKYTPSGKAVLSFTLACDRDYQTKAGDKKTDFVECVAWNTTAEFISRYFSKGRMAIVSGSLESRKWEAKNGDKRISWEVRVESIYFGDSKKDDQRGTNAASPSSSGEAGIPEGFTPIDMDDEDLPF